jgi:hypothetical protein
LISPAGRPSSPELAQIYTRLNQPAQSQEPMQIFLKLFAQEREEKVQRLDENQKRMANPNE